MPEPHSTGHGGCQKEMSPCEGTARAAGAITSRQLLGLPMAYFLLCCPLLTTATANGGAKKIGFGAIGSKVSMLAVNGWSKRKTAIMINLALQRQ